MPLSSLDCKHNPGSDSNREEPALPEGPGDQDSLAPRSQASVGALPAWVCSAALGAAAAH